MTAPGQARDRRALRWGGVVLVGLILIGRGLPLLREGTAASRRAALDSASRLERARGAQVRRGALEDTLRARSARFTALSPSLLSGSTAAAAAAELSRIVSNAATVAGVHVTSTRTHVDSVRSVFTPVSVRASATGDVSGVARLLASLERNQPLLALDDITITQPEVHATADRMETLRVELTVRGLAHAPNRAAR